jgi:DNA-binding LacI/PurR family transcriptional regulator
MDHLLALGHRRLLWLGLAGSSGAQRRRDLLRARAVASGAVMRECLLPQCASQTIAGALEWWRDAFASALPRQPPFTALIGYTDLITLAATQALWAAGRRVPADVSVLGFDDVHASYGCPALTAVDMRLTDIGRRAVDLLLDILDGAAPQRGHRENMPTRLVVRASTSSPSRSAS